MENKNIIAIIPARGGSKGIPKKNIKLLAGKELIAWTIEAALGSKYINRVIVSTDDKEIARVSKKYGSEVIKRPKELAIDKAKTIDAVFHALSVLKRENYNSDIIVLLQPTSPLRRTSHLDKAIHRFLKTRYDSLVSVCPSHAFLWKVEKGKAIPINYNFKKRARRQDIKPEYKENGAIYILERKNLIKERTIPNGKIGLYAMPEENSVEIDEQFDFWLCEKIIEKTMVWVKRPGIGIPAKYLDKVIGLKAKKNIKANQLLRWSDLLVP